jgi:replicative DNA helicase
VADDGFVIELEQQLLGAILAGGDHRPVFAFMDDHQLVDPIHQAIFAAARLALEHFSSTTVPVVLRLIQPEVLQTFKAGTGLELGAYMGRCTTDTLYSAGTTMAAARKVVAQWARIQLAVEAKTVAIAASAPETDVQSLLRSLASTVDDLGSTLRRGGRGRTARWLGESAEASLAASRAARERHGLTGITTGLVDIDRITGGLQRKNLILLGARPSMGKTTLGTSIALSAAKAGNGVGFLSIEMGHEQLSPRLLSDLAFRRAVTIPYESIINGSASNDELEYLDAIAADMAALPVRIEDSSGLTISDIRAKVEGMAAEFDAGGFALDLLVVDHLLKVKPTSRYSGNRVLELGEITEGMKELAKEFDLPVLLLTQLNRAVEQRDDKRPTLADLRDSGAIEQDADMVMFLYRHAYYLAREKPSTLDKQIERDADLAACLHQAEVEIAKQRNGRIDTIELFVDIGCSHFGNAARRGYGEMTRAA